MLEALAFCFTEVGGAGSSLWLAWNPLTHSWLRNRFTYQIHATIHCASRKSTDLTRPVLVKRLLCQFYNILKGKHDKCKGIF